MGNLRFILFLALLLLTASGCEIMEFRGFITSYENVNNRFLQSRDWNSNNNHTTITISQSAYSINVMSDSHVGGTKNLDTFFNNSIDEGATAVVMAGDITTGHKKDYDVFASRLPSMETLPYFAVVGNHDLYFDGWQHFYSIFGSSSYYFEVNTPENSDLFICLDTGGGTLGNLQFEWFKELLESVRAHYRYCVVFTHNNLFRFRSTASTNPMVEEIQVLQDLFLRHNVNMVVTGHDHLRNTDVLGNTTHIIMDAILDENDNASYLRLFIGEETIEFDFAGL